MTEEMTTRLMLTGALEGQDFQATAEHKYEKGVLELYGPPLSIVGIVKYHKRCWNVRVEGGVVDFVDQASVVGVTLEAGGSMAGKTFSTNNGYEFVKGKLELFGSAADVAGIMKYMRNSYQAVPIEKEEQSDGKCDVQAEEDKDGQPEVRSEVQSDGGQDPEGEAGEGEGRSEPEARDSGVRAEGDSDSARLLQVILDLDNENDNHWTKGGLPSLWAVRELFGEDKVTREDVEDAAPGHVREQE